MRGLLSLARVLWRLFGLQPSRLHPALYAASVGVRRGLRRLAWSLDGHRYATAQLDERLPHRVFKHTSKLIRACGGTELALQLGKVQNLRVAVPLVSGLLLRPGETFSFCRAVGPPTRARGFVDGMELSNGVARPGVGGGLCQLANLLHWLVLHSPLTVVERHHHSFDPFPDDGRVLPFGSGATVFFNYRDLRFRNDTTTTFQVRAWLTDKLLEGELRATDAPRFTYRVVEMAHRFTRERGKVFRSNELWREVRVRGHPATLVAKEFLLSNHAEVKYAPPPEAFAWISARRPPA